MTTLMVVAALLVGAGIGVGASVWWQRRTVRHAPAEALPVDVPHLVDLLRRAYGASVACVTTGDEDPVAATDTPRPPDTQVERTISAARLALADAREHVLREGQVVVAVGDGRLGAALMLAPGDADADRVKAVSSDLRRLTADLSISVQRELQRFRSPGAVPDWIAAGAESLEGMSHALCEAIRIRTGRSVAVAMRDMQAGACVVVAVSRGSDRRLLGLPVGTDCAVGRACSGGIPVAGASSADLFGAARAERRRIREEQGTAFPLRDGDEGAGVIVVFGPAETLEPSMKEWVLWLAVDAGPRLANAARMRAAEMRASTDDLTHLPNRRALERVVNGWRGGPGSLLLVDLDHFKQVNDSHGHAAGDAVLRQVARVFKRALREEDVAARIGGEEFALWLPHTPLAPAEAVAERVREAVAGAPVPWAGVELSVTCSVGVSSFPGIVTDAKNLFPSADAALYQAKSKGRNRVAVASAG
jgi:diguanylate cyclase (GGDEF)-like protein